MLYASSFVLLFQVQQMLEHIYPVMKHLPTNTKRLRNCGVSFLMTGH